MECNICGNEEFIDMNTRKAVRCSKCNSLERTRIMALFLQYHQAIRAKSRVLHIAPEKGLAEYLYSIAGNNCTFVDLQPEKFPYLKNIKKLDLCCDLDDIPSQSFDLIIHSHVMEHVPCNYTYVLYQLHRIMSTDANMVCSIPFLSGYYDCCASPKLSDKDREERFGQHDHVRRFGTTDLNMNIGKIYKLEDEYDITKYFAADTLIKYNIPRNMWQGYSPSSVLCLKKQDYRLR